jgi:uncharacterized protein
MEILLGFVIALMISLTGVGAGSMTTPLLILLLGVSPATAVGTALTFGAIVKIASVPIYALRRQVNFRILRLLLAGGVPGVLLGALVMDRLKQGGYSQILYIVLGSLIVSVSLFHLYRMLRPRHESAKRERPNLLWSLALPIGAEVGFSSAGAGALGSLLLLSFTRLTAAEVVGTDLCFGLGLSAIGSLIQVGQGNFDTMLLAKLVAGGLCGAFTGTLLAGRIAQRPLRFALLLVLVFLGFQLATHSSKAAPASHSVLQAERR